MSYQPARDRYERMTYRRTGRSGLLLPAISLGLWQNFGGDRPLETSRAIVRRAFDLGITHFDLANNYGPPYGSAEVNFGTLLRQDLRPYRDELVISTKAGYDMWPGPYGEWGSRKYLLASLDQSLARMGLEYVDIFYSHRFDPDTPLEETMGALDTVVRAGQGAVCGDLLVLGRADARGRRDPARSRHAAPHPPALVLDAQPLDRTRPARRARRARGRLHRRSRRSLRGCSRTSTSTASPRVRARAGRARSRRAWSRTQALAKIRELNTIAAERGQTLAQMALAWVLRDERVTSALIGASSVAQLEDNVTALDRLGFTDDELAAIDRYATDSGINIWA